MASHDCKTEIEQHLFLMLRTPRRSKKGGQQNCPLGLLEGRLASLGDPLTESPGRQS